MKPTRYTIISTSQSETRAIDLESAADLSGLHPEMILEFIRAEVVHAVEEDESGPRFDESGITRLRQIEHLRRQEQLSLRMLCQFVRLLDRLDTAEEELRRLRERLR